jgi:hypothetical protein
VCGLQYVAVLLFMDDNGEGGTFALYSLITRASNVRPPGAVCDSEQALSGFARADTKAHDDERKRPRRRSLADRLRGALASSSALQGALLVAVMVAACLVLADGVLTPAISVVSAISGLRHKVEGIGEGALRCQGATVPGRQGAAPCMRRSAAAAAVACKDASFWVTRGPPCVVVQARWWASRSPSWWACSASSPSAPPASRPASPPFCCSGFSATRPSAPTTWQPTARACCARCRLIIFTIIGM